ncbi:TBC1 domain family member 1 [Hondaea fermentalgiana]|uniref:TBC1 domain family member 1 n=1 Tax=Hondaea fermentalgiana TaxID=2315210 RepID=A0A2R5GXZ5_9STRA|nr:TBC1 domain family member 1 [Hondaea fermentalgiana]|eukprot:GBG32844.1 TBC1 domain family member 1 [Hondaea fermentalgiana]
MARGAAMMEYTARGAGGEDDAEAGAGSGDAARGRPGAAARGDADGAGGSEPRREDHDADGGAVDEVLAEEGEDIEGEEDGDGETKGAARVDEDGLVDVDENGNLVFEEEEGGGGERGTGGPGMSHERGTASSEAEEAQDARGASGASASASANSGARFPGGAAGLVGARAVGLARRQVKLARSAVSSRAEEELLRARAAVLERVGVEDDGNEMSNAGLVDTLRRQIRNEVNTRGGALVGALVDATREKLDKPGRAVPRRMFETFLALGKLALDIDDDEDIGYDSDDHGDCVDVVQRWVERSNEYIDNMQPEGRRWLELAMDSSVLDADADFSFAFEVELDEDLEHQINMDLPRTFPDMEYFDDPAVLMSMRRVLRGTAVIVPEVGYVQGMNFLVGYLMLHTKTEEDTLRLSVELMANPRYNMRNVFMEGLPSLRKLTAVLQSILRSRDAQLHKHFCDIGFEDLFFTYQWICTLFAGAFPFDALQDAWTLFFERGWVGVVAIVLTLMNDNRRALLRSDFEQAFARMKAAAANPKEGFAARAREMRFPPSQIREIEQAVL